MVLSSNRKVNFPGLTPGARVLGQLPDFISSFFHPQFPLHPQDEVLGSSGGGDHAVGHGFFQFVLGGTGFLRDREVLLESVGAPHRHGTADPDQLPSLDVEDLLVFVIEKFLSHLHTISLAVFGTCSPGEIFPDNPITQSGPMIRPPPQNSANSEPSQGTICDGEAVPPSCILLDDSQRYRRFFSGIFQGDENE